MLGLAPQTVPLMVAAFVAGLGIETFGVAWDVAMQSNIPADRLSRVYAYDWFGSLVFIPVGLALAGPVSALVGVRATIVGAAAGRGRGNARCVGGAECAQPASGRPGRAGQLAEPADNRLITSSCSAPLVATALPPPGPRLPAMSVNRPPASSTMMATAARS